MTCAKTTVTCTLVTVDGEHIVGTNHCNNPQPVCPRVPGEGYEKCKSICQQVGHAEIVALQLAGSKAVGSRAYLQGHTYACQQCQEALFAAGVLSLSVGSATQPVGLSEDEAVEIIKREQNNPHYDTPEQARRAIYRALMAAMNKDK